MKSETETNIKIVKFEPIFAEEMFAIHQAEMSDESLFSRQNFFEEFTLSNRTYYVALKQKEVVGYLGLFESDDDETIIGIAVKKEHQKTGVGTELLNFAAKNARYNKKKTLSLEVDERNLSAISFYKKHNFIVTNIRKNYYKNSDGIVMFRYL